MATPRWHGKEAYYKALKKMKLPTHPCHGCGKKIRSAICPTCKENMRAIINGEQETLE